MSEQNNNPPLSELQQKAIEWLQKKTNNKMGCETCGSSHWSVQDHIVTPIVLQNNSIQLGGVSYPQAMVICNNCGNTKYYNAVMMGLVQGTKQDGGDGGKKE